MPRTYDVFAGRGTRSVDRTFTEDRGLTDTVSAVLGVGGFVIGTDQPWAYNSGLAAGDTGASRVTVNGDLIINTPGTLIENRDIFGFVKVNAANVTLRNCGVYGRDAGGSIGYANNGNMIDCSANAGGTLVEFCTIRPTIRPTWFWEGIYGGGYTLRRCDVSGTVDGALVRTGNTIIEGNYFHDFYFSDQSQDQAGSSPPLWTHNDGVQLRMASQGPVRIVGNNFQWYPDETFPAPYDRTAVLRTGYGTSYYRNGLVSPYSGRLLWGSALTASPDLGPITQVVCEDNWLEGGTSVFQMSTTSPAGQPMTFGTLQGNRVGHDQFDFGNGSTYQIRYNTLATVVMTRPNVWDNVGSVIAWNPAKVGQPLVPGFTGGIRTSAQG